MARSIVVSAFVAALVAFSATLLHLRAKGNEPKHKRNMGRPAATSNAANTTTPAVDASGSSTVASADAAPSTELASIGKDRTPSMPTASTVPPVRLPGEFEHQEALLLAAGKLAERHPDTLASIASAVSNDMALLGIVSDARQYTKVRDVLVAHGLSPDRIRLSERLHDNPWMRDYGPILVNLRNGRQAAVHTIYQQWMTTPEDTFPNFFASFFGLSLITPRLALEGGNLLSNGKGLCLTTNAVISRNQRSAGSAHQYDEEQIQNYFTQCFGSTKTVILEPLVGDRTGHVDMFATFTASDTVVVGSYHPAMAPVNAAVLDRNAETLAGLMTPTGPLRVERIPMPPDDRGVFRTYTNVIYTNDTVLMPIYPGLDPEAEQQARETYRRLLPGRNVVGIDVTDMITEGGGLHCLVTNIPACDPVSEQGEGPATLQPVSTPAAKAH